MCLDRKTAEQLYDSGKEKTVEWMLRISAKVDELAAKVEELTAQVARLSKNSSNSSKPPSSDITTPPTNRAERRRQKKMRVGGQEGHRKWERAPWSGDEVTPIEHEMTSCPDCSGPLRKCADIPPRVLQQAELPAAAVEKIEHRTHAYWCPRCKKTHYAPFPAGTARQGLFGPRLAATVCFLKYAGCMSISGIRKYLADALGVPVTNGYLAKVLRKGAGALEGSYDELLRAVPLQPVINGDETGHKENGESHWTWVFRASLFALFKISPSRGSDVLVDVLGKEFNGVLGCDYFSAYRKYMAEFNVTVQFCLAHLIRDVKFLVDFPDASVKRYGTKVLDALRGLFHVIHRRDAMSPERFAERLEAKRLAVLKAATGYVPVRSEAQNLAKRFREHGDAYFSFITTPAIQPTNNCAEQAIRFVVIYRKVSQGTRSINGRIACERFFTAIATCAMQGRSVFTFIKNAIENHCAGLPGPSLLPAVNSS